MARRKTDSNPSAAAGFFGLITLLAVIAIAALSPLITEAMYR